MGLLMAHIFTEGADMKANVLGDHTQWMGTEFKPIPSHDQTDLGSVC